MSEQAAMYTHTNVREVLIAKAIRSGYNPYCRSTDKNARKVSEKMRADVKTVKIPRTAMLPTAKVVRPAIREVKSEAARRAARARREVVTLENFELVKRKSTRVSLASLVSVLVCAVVFALIVYSGSLVNLETRRASDLSDSQASLLATQKTLAAQLDARYDLDLIETVAVNDLGMVKVADAAQRYVSLSNGNSIETYDPANTDTSVGVTMLNAFGEKIGSALEYLD